MNGHAAASRRIPVARSLASVLGLTFLILGPGCDSLSGSGMDGSPAAEKDEFRTLELDLFTLTFHATRAEWGAGIHLTGEGEKYFRKGSREAGILSDSQGAYVVPEFEPARWEAYICLERRAQFTDSLPDKPPVAEMMSGDPVRYYYFLEDPGDGSCQKFMVGYIFGKGFRIAPAVVGVGTLTIRYC